MSVQTLNAATFDEVIGGADRPVLVDFWAEWCGPCRMVAPVVEELERDHSDQLVVAKLNVDDEPGIAQRYDVMSIPTLLVFSEGNLVKRIVGAKPRAALESDLAEILA